MRHLGAFLFMILFSFIGCTGIEYLDNINVVDIRDSPVDEIKSRVSAQAEEWRNSGVRIVRGNRYRITARGRWHVGGTCGWTGPDGTGVYNLVCWDIGTQIVKGWTSAALIAKIGETGQPFGVGSEYEFTADDQGVLFFRINDMIGYCGDNSGHLIVRTSMIASTSVLTSPSLIQAPQKDTNSVPNRKETMRLWAVIIGISKYQHSGQDGLTNLIFADDDAKALARSLRNLGWHDSHIRLITNEKATQRNIMIALESWLSKAGPNDQIILFWAGHAFPDPENSEKVYFACYDTDISIPATGYRMDNVRRSLEEKRVRNVILLADTCHAGKLITRGERGISIVPQIDKMQSEQKVPKGWIFMVGADTDRQAIEHTSWTNGAFTHSLIKGLNGEADGFQSAGIRDGVITMGELKDYMKTSMPHETQRVLGVAKHPVITTTTGDPDIWNLTFQPKQYE